MEINDLLEIGPGTVLELDRKVGEAIDSPRRGCSGRREARRDHDGNHQGGAWLMREHANREWRMANRGGNRITRIRRSPLVIRDLRTATEEGNKPCGS